MNYTQAILQLLTWPLLIIISFLLTMWVIKKVESKEASEGKASKAAEEKDSETASVS